MGLLIKIFKARSTQGFRAGFCTCSCLYLFDFVSSSKCVFAKKPALPLRLCVTLILDFYFTRMQLMNARNSSPAITWKGSENSISVKVKVYDSGGVAARHTETLRRHPFAVTIIIA